MDSNPNTKGDNKTWNLWFRADGPEKASGYAEKWAKYRLQGQATTLGLTNVVAAADDAQPGGIKGEVEASRQRIANVAGVPVEAVKITIDFGI